MTEEQEEIKIPRSIRIPKGCTKDRAQEIARWAYKVWAIHWQELAPTGNNRVKFLSYCIRDHDILTEDFMQEFENHVRAYTSYLWKKKRAGDKLVGVQHLSTWYNQAGYESMFIEESSTSLKDRTRVVLEQCECGAEVHGPAYDYCVDCLYRLNDKWSEYRKQELLKLGLYEPGQTLDVTVAKCREWLRTKRFKFRDLVREPS